MPCKDVQKLTSEGIPCEVDFRKEVSSGSLLMVEPSAA